MMRQRSLVVLTAFKSQSFNLPSSSSSSSSSAFFTTSIDKNLLHTLIKNRYSFASSGNHNCYHKSYRCYTAATTILYKQKGEDKTQHPSFHFVNDTCNSHNAKDYQNDIDLDMTLSSSSLSIQSNYKHNVSYEKVTILVSSIDKIPIGSLRDAQLRQACQILHSMAHFGVVINNISYRNNTDDDSRDKESPPGYNEKAVKFLTDEQKGRYAFTIFKRLLLEIGCYDNEGSKFVINERTIHHQNPKSLYLDSKVFHDASKCMLKSHDKILINHANDILQQLERYYLDTKSKILHPTARTYSLLFDALKDYYNNDNHIISSQGSGYSDSIEENNRASKTLQMDIVTQIQQLMDRIKQQQTEGNPQVLMNSHLYNSALNALADHSGNNPNASKLLQQMMTDDKARLDHVSYSIAIKSFLSNHNWLDVIDASSGMTTAKMIEKLLVEMQSRGLGNPSAKTMTPILQALSKEGNTNEISSLIDWMEEMYHTWKWEDIRPNNYHFNTMITALSRKSSEGKVRSGSGHLALEILNKMKSLYEDGGNHNVRPDLITYNAVLHAISKEENSQGTKKVRSDIGERAEALLRRMEDGDEGDYISPDIFSYNAVLSAYMNSATIDAATKTQQLLQRMREKDVDPDLVSYTICINTLSKSKVKGSAQQAEDLLRLLENEYANGCEELKPDVKCYNSVIHAWANNGEKGAIQRAHQILCEMQSMRRSGKRPDLIPDAISFTSILSAIAHDTKRGTGNDSQQILDTMFNILKDNDNNGAIELDRVAYNALINAQSKQSGSSERAEMLLDYMLEQDGASGIRPNVITFNTVLDAISKTKEKGAAARAEIVLNKMQQMYEKGCKDVRPDTFSFASVLNAYANSSEPGAASQAEKILKHMQLLHEDGNTNVIPNTICFSTVIKAYSRSPDKGSAKKAEDILRWMFQVREAGNVEVAPNTIAFTSVCDAWSKSNEVDAVDRVQALIEWMNDLSMSGYTDVRPNEYTYNCLISAIARSKDPQKANKALNVLRYMQSDPKLSINIFNYNNVLSACSYTHGTTADRFNAIKIAVAVIEEAMEQASLDDRLTVTFGIFFQACSNLVDGEAEKAKIEKVVETVFHRCCDAGQVDSKLLLQFRKAATTQLFLKLFGKFKSFPRIHVKEIPKSWTQNVVKNRAVKYK